MVSEWLFGRSVPRKRADQLLIFRRVVFLAELLRERQELAVDRQLVGVVRILLEELLEGREGFLVAVQRDQFVAQREQQADALLRRRLQFEGLLVGAHGG